MQLLSLHNSLRVTRKCKFLMWLPQQPLWSTISSLPPRAFPWCTPVELTKTPPFWFEMTDLALAWEPQTTPPMDPSKDMCPRSYHSLSALCFHFPLWPVTAYCVLPPGPVSNNPLYFNFSCGLLLNHINYTPLLYSRRKYVELLLFLP